MAQLSTKLGLAITVTHNRVCANRPVLGQRAVAAYQSRCNLRVWEIAADEVSAALNRAADLL